MHWLNFVFMNLTLNKSHPQNILNVQHVKNVLFKYVRQLGLCPRAESHLYLRSRSTEGSNIRHFLDETLMDDNKCHFLMKRSYSS